MQTAVVPTGADAGFGHVGPDPVFPPPEPPEPEPLDWVTVAVAFPTRRLAVRALPP